MKIILLLACIVIGGYYFFYKQDAQIVVQLHESDQEVAEISKDAGDLALVSPETDPLVFVSEGISKAVSSSQQIDWMAKLPESLQANKVISFDEITDRFGNSTRRAIVSTETALGNIFVRERVSSHNDTQIEIYGAEHILVSPSPNAEPSVIQQLIHQCGFESIEPNEYGDFLYVKLPAFSPNEFVSAYELLKEVLDEKAEIEMDGVSFSAASVVPSDPFYVQQWHHENIDSNRAWGISTGADSVIIAVLDSGINSGLAEFSGRLVDGYDFVNDDNDPTDDNGHGTKVSGVIAANANNGVGTTGVDWNCKIMPVKVLNDSGAGYHSQISLGINYAKDNGAHIINYSAGGYSPSSIMTNAINDAIAEGLIFVTISHNDGNETIRFPGSMTQTICVGSVGENDTRATSSNSGPELDLVAPGQSIQTINLNGTIATVSGTSYAAPFVSGSVALLLSIDPELDQESALELLKAGAEDRVGDEAEDVLGFDNYYGWGRLNVYNSLKLAQTAVEAREVGRTEVTSNPSVYNLLSTSDASAMENQALSSGRNEVINAPSIYGLLSEDSIIDGRLGSIGIEAVNGVATLNLQIERSENLSTWTQDAEERLSIPIQMDTDKAYFRFKVAD